MKRFKQARVLAAAAAAAVCGLLWHNAFAAPTTYADAHGDQVGSSNAGRDIYSASVDDDGTYLYFTINDNPAANLSTSNFFYGIGITTGVSGAGGDTSAAADHGNPLTRTFSIDSTLGGMLDYVDLRGVNASGNNATPIVSFIYNDYTFAGGTWSKHTASQPGVPLVAQQGGTTLSSMTVAVPIADFASNFAMTLGTTINFDMYSTGTGNGQTAYDSLADQSPTNGTNSATTQYNGTVLDAYTLHANAAPLSLVWNNSAGVGDGSTWDVAQQPGVTGSNLQQNWLNGSVPFFFFQNNAVTFNDNNNGHYNVTLNGSVSPAAVTFDNSGGDYTLGGTGTIAGNGSLMKTGTSTLIITNSNSYTGGTTINQGSLQIGNGGTNGSIAGPIVTNANLVYNRSDTATVNNAISGSGNVVHAGPGTLILNGNLSYTGSTTVQAGTLIVSTSKGGGGAFSVNDNATLTLNSASSTTTLNVSGLTTGNNSAINFMFGLQGNHDSGSAVIHTAALTNTGAGTLNVFGGNFSLGTIHLIQYDSGAANFTLGSLGHLQAHLQDTGSSLDLVITLIDQPKWTGLGNGAWDTNSGNPTKNWVLASNGTTPTDYIEGDIPQFDDSATNTTVNLDANVTPNGVNVSSTKDFTFTGNGSIGGVGPLNKFGPGRLTIANSGNNTFSGPITIGAGTFGSAGTLQIGAGTTSGSVGLGSITMSDNANLVLDRSDGVNLPNTISGSGNIEVASNSVATLSASNSYDGTTTVDSGATLIVADSSALGSGSGATTVQSGGSLYAQAGGLTIAEPLNLSGSGNGNSAGALHVGGSGLTTTFTGPVALQSSVTLQADTGAAGVLSTPLSGAGFDITVDGGGTWVLAADGNNYANSIVNNGTLSMGNGAAAGTIGTGQVTVGSSGTFQINRSDAITFGTVIGGQGAFVQDGGGTVTLTADNTFTGSVLINRGVLKVVNNNAVFGSGPKTLAIDSRNKGLELDGGVTLPNSISYTLANDATGTVPFAIHSMTGTNIINGDISLADSPANGKINSVLKVDAGGTLIINGNISSQSGAGTLAVGFGGSGTTILNGVISDSPGLDLMGIQLVGTGAPNLIINSANTCTSNVSLQSGTATLMNAQGLGLTAGTFCFIGNGGGAFANVAAALNIGTDGLTVTNNLWTNRDGAGSLQTAIAETNQRFIGYSGATGAGTFSGEVQINGGAVFQASTNGTLVMSGQLHNGTETFDNGGRNDVFVTSAGTVIFSGDNSYTGYTQMNSGTLILASSSAQSLVLTGTGANTGTMTLPGGADIRGGRMVFDYGASGSGDPVSTIRGLLQTSLQQNFATGQLRVGNATPGIGIGYIDDTANNRLQLLRTYLGDANTDGRVNALDFNALATNYGAIGNAVWTQGDFNYDGNVDTSDFVLMSNEFGQVLPTPPAPALGSLVPEPAMLVSLPAGALLLLRRRARRRR